VAIPELPAVIDAIVLDANCMPKGRFSQARLEDMLNVIDGGELGIEIWIPEPVIWEWAEHVHGDVKLAKAPFERALAHAKAAGYDFSSADLAGDALSDVESVAAHIENILDSTDGVEVLRFSAYPEAASLGLRDQILLTGAGRRKPAAKGPGVKTGAADSASFRLVEKHADDRDLGAVLVFSADKDALSHFEGRDAPVIVQDEWRRLKSALLKLEPADAVLSEQLVRVVSEALLGDFEKVGAESMTVGADAPFKSWMGDSEQYLDVSTSIIAIESVSSVSEVVADRKEGFGSALADVAVELEATAVWWNDVDDRLEHDFENVTNVPAQVLVSLTRDGSEWEVIADVVYVANPD
jgi:hypothetical protein